MRGSFYHDTKVGDRNIWIGFQNRAGSGNYEIEYMVDNHLSRHRRNPPSPNDAHKILAHVHGKVSQFMRVAKPKRVSFTSDLEQKQKLHKVLADHLAKKFGGRVGSKYLKDRDTIEHSVEKD